MTDFNTCALKIVFKYNRCNNKFMNVSVNDEEINPVNDYATYEKTLCLPETITIKTSGKNPKYDTKVDSEGKISEDMSVQIESISLDSFELNELYLHQKIKILTDSGDVHTTSYFGFNGTVNLDFLESNVFAQVLMANGK